MFNRIRIFLQDKKTRRQLKAVLQLLYSEKKYEANELVSALSPKDNIQELEYYVILDVAAKLQRPFTTDDITNIWEQQVKALESYVASKELRETIMELLKAKANLSMLHFNVFMDRLREANEYNNYSPGGMLLRTLIAKGRPLTQDEEIKVNESYKEIKRLDELALQKLEELENHMKSNF
jgi:hypothetical protein